ncbi:MAG: alkyl hydroperoxide reductase [Kordiimonas sp.]|nr:alkyl hydroperoxide reductase [Kordiimonas sp.]|tara:strand:- start:5135 stop:5737 length:603 start_codon:yes stop_codon:yes gene_type:complete
MSSLIGQKAPDFTASAVMEDDSIVADFNLTEYLDGDYGLVFFYPLDFTFVCPSEIIAFSNRMDKFKELGTKVIGVSVDSQFSHYAWRNTPVEKGGVGSIQFPLVADITKNIARDFGVLINDAVALRGTFLIDKEGNIRHYVINDLPLGRNVDEAIRMVEALQFHEEHGEVCPAGWQKGKAGMTANAEGVASYLADNAADL